MDGLWTTSGTDMDLALRLLFVFGLVYCVLIYYFFPKWNIKHRTAEEVVFGTLVTVAGFGFGIGWETKVTGAAAVAAMLMCFGATGLPMVLGYWWLDSWVEAEDEKKAKQMRERMINKKVDKE